MNLFKVYKLVSARFSSHTKDWEFSITQEPVYESMILRLRVGDNRYQYVVDMYELEDANFDNFDIEAYTVKTIIDKMEHYILTKGSAAKWTTL